MGRGKSGKVQVVTLMGYTFFFHAFKMWRRKEWNKFVVRVQQGNAGSIPLSGVRLQSHRVLVSPPGGDNNRARGTAAVATYEGDQVMVGTKPTAPHHCVDLRW